MLNKNSQTSTQESKVISPQKDTRKKSSIVCIAIVISRYLQIEIQRIQQQNMRGHIIISLNANCKN